MWKQKWKTNYFTFPLKEGQYQKSTERKKIFQLVHKLSVRHYRYRAVKNVHRLTFQSVVIFKFVHNNFIHLKLQSWIQFHNLKFQFSNFCVSPKEYSFCCDCWGWMRRYVHRGHNNIVRVKAERIKRKIWVHRGHNEIVRVKAEESWKFNCTNKVVKLRFQSNKENTNFKF